MITARPWRLSKSTWHTLEGRTFLTHPYYVATRAVYVLVDADTEAEARRLGENALRELYRTRLRREVMPNIQTVRLATPDEIWLAHSSKEH